MGGGVFASCYGCRENWAPSACGVDQVALAYFYCAGSVHVWQVRPRGSRTHAPHFTVYVPAAGGDPAATRPHGLD